MLTDRLVLLIAMQDFAVTNVATVNEVATVEQEIEDRRMPTAFLQFTLVLCFADYHESLFWR